MLSAAAAQPAGGGGGSAASAAAASAAASSLARHWLVQLLGGLEVTVAHALTLQREQPSGGVCGLASPCLLLQRASSVADTALYDSDNGLKTRTKEKPFASVSALTAGGGGSPVPLAEVAALAASLVVQQVGA